MNTAPIVSKVWSFCTTLRDDGVGYGDYLEQLTYLIFLKMADEYGKPPRNRDVGIPAQYNWSSLRSKRGAELESHYVTLLRELGARTGMLGQIFTKAQNKIQDPAKLYRLIDMVDDTEWVTMVADIKGDIYEGLLEKNAEDTKSGAGQYFTPRALIRAMVECVRPEPRKLIADPACGTGGFFLAAYDFLTNQDNFKLDRQQNAFLKHETFHGNEIVANTRRLCLMNMLLHNIGEIDGDAPISPNDALVADPGQRFDYVFANPPFGKKSSMSFTNEEGEQETDDLTYNRQDFWAATSNKQLNFVQHIRTMLKTDGRAAVVVPDNVLFEGGAGETIRKKLLDNTDLHTILRLPTGVFYAQGVKANVIFFDKRARDRQPCTSVDKTHTLDDDCFVEFRFDWNLEKNQQLIEQRGISFERVVSVIEQGGVVDVLDHPNQQRYRGQRVYVVDIDGYLHLVPFVTSADGSRFLKTIIPSRKATRDHKRGRSS